MLLILLNWWLLMDRGLRSRLRVIALLEVQLSFLESRHRLGRRVGLIGWCRLGRLLWGRRGWVVVIPHVVTPRWLFLFGGPGRFPLTLNGRELVHGGPHWRLSLDRLSCLGLGRHWVGG